MRLALAILFVMMAIATLVDGVRFLNDTDRPSASGILFVVVLVVVLFAGFVAVVFDAVVFLAHV